MFLSVALKVCEACGSLRYRPRTNTSPYCAHCVEMFKDFPTVESRKLRGRPGRKRNLPTNLPVVYANAEEDHA